MRPLSLACGLLLGLAACTPEAPPPKTAATSYRIASMRWLPPGDNIVYSYKTEDLVAKTSGVMTMSLHNPVDDSIDLRVGQRSEVLRYQEKGILRERQGVLLIRTPPERGARWPAGPNASARVERDGLRIAVEAGSFEGCVEIIEERLAPVRGVITTSFCPDVGIVRIETTSEDPPIHERVELRSFGKAIDLSQKEIRLNRRQEPRSAGQRQPRSSSRPSALKAPVLPEI